MEPWHFLQSAVLILPACPEEFVAEQQKSGAARSTYVSILKKGGETRVTNDNTYWQGCNTRTNTERIDVRLWPMSLERQNKETGQQSHVIYCIISGN